MVCRKHFINYNYNGFSFKKRPIGSRLLEIKRPIVRNTNVGWPEVVFLSGNHCTKGIKSRSSEGIDEL